MGWYFGNNSRADLVEELTRTTENEDAKLETLRKFFSGNNMWTVQQVTRKDTGEVTRFICVYLMRRHGSDWGSQTS